MINIPKLWLLAVVVLFAACTKSKSDDETICTNEFVVIVVRVAGENLDDYFTVRTSNNDTIRLDTQGYPISNWYPIIDDNYQPVLENQREEFYFVGLKNNLLILNQRYEIGADKCHVIKYSGPAEIVLE